ncbi:MAG: SDR family oxidoreductase [Isosphaeraceae bacterium]|nr:SDR family oxidoreductase [Isosphaeraceae bacterium]
MGGKICLVTGATAGIGAVTAEELARRGAQVILVGRDRSKCETTATRIRERTDNSAVEFLVADLSAQAEVRRLAREFQERYPRLDVLVNNAGAMFGQRQETVDGIERTFALNHLAYFLLTNLLLDTLKASAPARIVVVSSEAHRMAKGLDFDDLQHQRWYKPFRVYCESKLANLLFTYELARRLRGTGVTANALHPGFVATNFMAGEGFAHWSLRRAARLFAISPEEGAKTSVYLAASPEVEGVSGAYFVKQKPVPSSPASRNEAAARRLWQISEELTGLGISQEVAR